MELNLRRSIYYLANLYARGGQFRAVQKLSPLGQSLATPLFHVPAPPSNKEYDIDDYLMTRARGIYESRSGDRPVYIDAHDFSPELRTAKGKMPVAALLEFLSARGARVVPTTGTESVRGLEEPAAIRNALPGLKDGICLRLPIDELNEPHLLKGSISNAVDSLGVTLTHVDLVLDLGYVGSQQVTGLAAVALEALHSIQHIGEFRNIAVSATSIPERLGKTTQGKVLRIKRAEVALWIQLLDALGNTFPIAFGDFGVVGANYVPPNKYVVVPPRCRYTTENEHVVRRGQQGEYASLCRQLAHSEDYAGRNFSVGDNRIAKCANGLVTPGGPGAWVECDTNHHLELVSRQVLRILEERGPTQQFAPLQPMSWPWLQTELI